MKFKIGDIVIKNTGGNKMKVISYSGNNLVSCAWFTEIYNESKFNEEDIIPISQYSNVLITEKRDDLIDQILHENNKGKN